jgi:hypothetical protein
MSLSALHSNSARASRVVKHTVEGFVLVDSVVALAAIDTFVVVDAFVLVVTLAGVAALAVVGHVGFNPRAVHDADPVYVLVPV